MRPKRVGAKSPDPLRFDTSLIQHARGFVPPQPLGMSLGFGAFAFPRIESGRNQSEPQKVTDFETSPDFLISP